VKTPCLVLAGNDEAHPYPIAEDLSKLIPNCEFIADWKSGAALTAATARVKEFLAKQHAGSVIAPDYRRWNCLDRRPFRG